MWGRAHRMKWSTTASTPMAVGLTVAPPTARRPFYRGRAGSRGRGVPTLSATRQEEGAGVAVGWRQVAGNGPIPEGAGGWRVRAWHRTGAGGGH
jgi:hypothetical protein